MLTCLDSTIHPNSASCRKEVWLCKHFYQAECAALNLNRLSKNFKLNIARTLVLLIYDHDIHDRQQTFTQLAWIANMARLNLNNYGSSDFSASTTSVT